MSSTRCHLPSLKAMSLMTYSWWPVQQKVRFVNFINRFIKFRTIFWNFTKNNNHNGCASSNLLKYSVMPFCEISNGNGPLRKKNWSWKTFFRKIFLQYAFRKGYVDRSSRPRGVFNNRWSENRQEIYRRTPMPKYDFNKVSKQLNCKIRFSVKLQSSIERIHLLACNVLKECFKFSCSTQMLHGKTVLKNFTNWQESNWIAALF